MVARSSSIMFYRSDSRHMLLSSSHAHAASLVVIITTHCLPITTRAKVQAHVTDLVIDLFLFVLVRLEAGKHLIALIPKRPFALASGVTGCSGWVGPASCEEKYRTLYFSRVIVKEGEASSVPVSPVTEGRGSTPLCPGWQSLLSLMGPQPNTPQTTHQHPKHHNKPQHPPKNTTTQTTTNHQNPQNNHHQNKPKKTPSETMQDI
ncbi:hypothetical protein J6590_024581 [Homalodisca vitripennis]|nr:hypothetical protein J6590_024581 [Homalodisca vitripennis]